MTCEPLTMARHPLTMARQVRRATLPSTPACHVHDRVMAALNAINDPCSVGQGIPLGLVDMGLIRGVVIEEEATGSTVLVRMILTGPCLFVAFFEARVVNEILALSGVSHVAVQWDSCVEWTPDLMSARAQERRRQHATRLLAIKLAARSPRFQGEEAT